MNTRTVFRFSAAILLLCVSGHAAAQDICAVPPNAKNVPGQLAKVRARDCFGGSEDSASLTRKIIATLSSCDAKTAAEQAALRKKLGTDSRLVEGASAALSSGATVDWKPILGALQGELTKSSAQLDDVHATPAPENWKWDDHATLQQTDGTFAVSYLDLLESKCDGSGSDGCAKALATAEEVNRFVNLSRALHQCAAHEHIAAIEKRLNELNARWDDYFFNTRSQYIWELLINSWRYKGSDAEFGEPPGDQLIVAHPGVTLEYVGGGAQNDKAYAPILMAEIIGYNRFKWPDRTDSSGDKLPSRLPPLGISLVGTYSPDNDGKHVGYGVMFHVNNVYLFGVGRRDTGAGDETVYLLSVDLMKRLLKPSENTMKEFRNK